MEDLLVDTANILAELARDDLAALPSGGTLQGTRFAQAVSDYASRPVDAKIWGLSKTRLDYRVYVTDAAGRVVFDAGAATDAPALGQDYSQWRDVALTLQGRYGARATREVTADDRTSVLYVAAPVKRDGQVIGVLTVAKPMHTVQPFVDRAERQILTQGAWLLALSLVIGAAVTLWMVWSVRKLRRFAQEVQFGARREPPQLPGELGDLAQAMQAMRLRLEDHRHIEHTVRALTHELKSPMAAIAGAAELLHDELPAADRQAFAQQIQQQVQRQQALVDRMLELSKLEHRRSLADETVFALQPVVCAVLRHLDARLARKRVAVRWLEEAQAEVRGERELVELAVANVLDNAIGFSPWGGALELAVCATRDAVELRVRDHGPGVPDFMLPRLGERFLSTPRPDDGAEPERKGTGLGLAIVREVMTLHRGSVAFEPAAPGLRVTLRFEPASRGQAVPPRSGG
jgi:two-component system sensor histidine kinase CreC